MKSNHPFRSWGVLRALLILLFMTVSIQWATAQLTLNIPRTTLGAAIQKIRSQSDYQFFYSDKLAATPVDAVKVKDTSLEKVLFQLLKDKNITFKIEDNIVYLSEKESKKTEQRQTGKERKVSGQVTDSKGEPLIGVSIQVKGTNEGAITDMDGNYTITTKAANPVLVFSYIGYKRQEIAQRGEDNAKITMIDDSQVIDEVVVTALGIKRATKALSYNVQEVKGDDFLTNKDANFINSLSGKVAGVTINSSSSGVGGASKVVMRGSKAIAQSSNALYVIDGVPMFNLGGEGGQEFDSKGTTEAIADINPEDIESMSVLTGAAAAALYGSHAANGAIVITTKKGKEGRVKLTVSQNTDFLRPFRMPEFQDRYGTGDLLSPTASVEKSWGNKLIPANYMGYNPADDFLQTGVVTTETVSLSTGTEKNQTYFSASAVNSKGMIPNNDYNRYNFTFRNTTSFLKDKMTLDISANYIKQNDRNMVNQGTYSNPLVSAYLFPRGNDWNDIKMYEHYDTTRKISTQYWPGNLFSSMTGQNPYWTAYRNLRENDKDRYMLSAGLTYKILDWLSVAGRVRIDNSNNDYTKKLYATSNSTLTNEKKDALLRGSFGVEKITDKQTYSDFMININKTFFEELSIQANIGASYSDLSQNVLSNEGPISEKGLANVFNVMQLDNTKTKRTQSGYHEQTQSIFASAEIGYKSTYYLTLTGRTDWPSQLAGPSSVKSAFFYPSVGGSIILSELLPMPELISFLKFRGSYASVGLPFPRFLAQPTYKWDEASQSWLPKTHYPMTDLKPEKTNSWEIGLTARFLKHFNLDVSLYTAKTYNQTFDPKISPSSGYSTLYVQTGNVQNKGIEVALGYQNDWNGKFSWASNLTFSANKNKIMELMENYENPVSHELVTLERLDIGGLGSARFVLKKGGSLGDLYSTADIRRDSNGNIYVDANGEVSSNTQAEDIKLGSVFPKCNLAWRNDFKWKQLSFGFMLSARVGGIVYSATQAYLDYYGVSEATATARDFGGVPVNGNDLIDAGKWYSVVAGQNGVPQYYTYNATNLRLQEASIGYTLPRNKLGGIADITVSLVGRNLWMIYCKAPFDPEAVATTGNYYQGIDNFMMPSTRNLGFNVRLNF